MKNIINYVLGLLLSLSIICLIGVFTFANNTYIYQVVNKNKCYEDVYKNIVNELKEYNSSLDYKLGKYQVKDDLSNYINMDMDVPNLKSKIKLDFEDKEIDNIYIRNIKFYPRKNYKNDCNILYIVSFISVLITGYLFLKTKSKHNLEAIILVSSIINILVYGALYVFNKFDGINLLLFNSMLHVLLFVACLMFMIAIAFYNEDKINKILKRNYSK